MTRRFRSLAPVPFAAAALALGAAAPAGAATNPYTPVGVCGAGFKVIQQHNITGPAGGVLGTAYLLWDGRSKRNCAVTIKRRAIGIATFTEVGLSKVGAGARYMTDGTLDGYKYYAGPLYVKAPGQCVIFGGRMRDAKGNGGSWITPQPVHCG